MAEALTTGGAATAVSNRTVQLMRQYLGRGPTKTRTTVDRDHVLVVMRDTLTAHELALAEHGYQTLVLDARQALQEILRPELTEFIENLFHRKVIGFMSANQLDPDLAAEVFVLEASVPFALDLQASDGNAGGHARHNPQPAT
jgi:uncharacterized protein YbcI